MIVVDTHCHAGRNWFEPIELLLYQMSLNNVDKAALIGHGGSFDNTYLLECMQRFPGRFAVVVVIDTDVPDAPATLERWAAAGAGGVRLGPTVRSPGADPLAIWRKAAELGLVVSSLGQPDGFASREFAQAVAEFPQLPIIVEHLAGVGVGAEPPYATYKAALAMWPATRIPTSRSAAWARSAPDHPVLRPKFGFDHVPPLLELAYDAFGPRRMMWGSDYPPVSEREGYRNALHGVMDHPALRDPADREWIMGKTALNVFPFT